jgi:hypothetical protein
VVFCGHGNETSALREYEKFSDSLGIYHLVEGSVPWNYLGARMKNSLKKEN